MKIVSNIEGFNIEDFKVNKTLTPLFEAVKEGRTIKRIHAQETPDQKNKRRDYRFIETDFVPKMIFVHQSPTDKKKYCLLWGESKKPDGSIKTSVNIYLHWILDYKID